MATKILFVAIGNRTGQGPPATSCGCCRGSEERFGADVVFRHEAGPLALDLQHAGAMVLDLGAPGPSAPRVSSRRPGRSTG